MKYGIFGGTFNPPHNWHKKIIERSIKELQLDFLYVIPNYINIEKTVITSSIHRLEMSKLMVEEIIESNKFFKGKLEVSDWEINQGGISETYKTIRHFSHDNDDEWYFIMGSDSSYYFENWKEPEYIKEKVILVSFDRPQKITPHDYMIKIKGETNSISSSKIRKSKNYSQVPQKVQKYIKKEKLYE